MVKSNLVQLILNLEVKIDEGIEKQQDNDYPKHDVAPTDLEIGL